MKNKLLAFISFFAVSLGVNSQTFSQYFDGADTMPSNSIIIHMDTSANNIWQVGPPQKSIFDSAATVPNVMITDTVNSYPINNQSNFFFGVNPQFFGWGVLAFQWKQKLDMDSAQDGGYIEFSIDTGKTWQSVFSSPYVYSFYGFDSTNYDTLPNGQYAFSGRDTTWKDIWLCFDVSWLSTSDSLMLRYVFQSDSIDNNREGWMIDNMLIHLTIIHTINEVKSDSYMKIHPNPTTGRINIETKKIDDYHIIDQIELVDIEGKVVQEWGVSPTKFYIDIGNHPNGVYFLKIKTNLKTETFKVLLEK